jgi:hypothetical protein
MSQDPKITVHSDDHVTVVYPCLLRWALVGVGLDLPRHDVPDANDRDPNSLVVKFSDAKGWP